MKTPLIAALIVFAMTSNTFAQSETDKLHQLFAEREAWQMVQYPEMAMSKGDYSHADRLTDTSLAAIEKRLEVTRSHLEKLHAIQRQVLAADDQVNYDLFELHLSYAIERNRYRTFLAPISGRDGPQQDIPQMADRVRFKFAEDYANYLKRLQAVPTMVDATIELLRTGMKEGRTPPQVVLKGVEEQFAALLADGGLKSLDEPFEHMPATISPDEQAKFRSQHEKLGKTAVASAIRKLSEFYQKIYLPGCRTTIAAIDWPDGEAFYAFQLRVMTTTILTPSEIHELGHREVARIRKEMMAVIQKTDFARTLSPAALKNEDKVFRDFITFLRTDSRFYYTTPADLIERYRDICKQVDAQLPRFFGTLPRLPYGVKEIPLFMAPQQTTAYYQSGDIRNAEAGYFMANTYALDQRPKYEMIALAMHESVPGHHLQIALSQEMENQPEFRKDMFFNAFGEGWALYAERLGIEMGMYADPYDDFGRLLYEMWRACRLVVDPGMHALGWSRERAVKYMLDNTALSELNINNEIDRYIAWPGQACAYKIGELRIRELRSRAEQALGKRFDLREFHDVVLSGGAVPLYALEARVNAWIKSK